MKKALFDFVDYRAYLSNALPTQGLDRGGRVRIATALGVQKGFISSVIHGSADIGLEQAFRVSRFFEHSDDERDYFLLLVQIARAGSKDLEKYYRGKVDEILRRRREIRERIQVQANLSETDQVIYYSSWHPIAVHMCLRVPTLNTAQSIASYLGLSAARVSKTLAFLVRTGLAELRGNSYFAGPTRIHLPADSPLVDKHHTNWRMQAVQSLDRPHNEDLHYSSVMSISREAAEKIRELLMQTIQAMEPTIRDAKDEGVFVLAMDLLELKASGH